jgi:uncharacterized protein with PIN domain
MSKAQQLLETMNDFTKSDDEIVMRSNFRHGTRCPHCGRMLSRITQLPAVRTCPSRDCGNKYEISKSSRGLSFVRQY